MIELDAIFVAYSGKRTNPEMGDDSPLAPPRLFMNRKGKFYLVFSKTEADGTPIFSSIKNFSRLEDMAEKVIPDKLHRLICTLVGVRHLMSDLMGGDGA